MIKTEVLGQGPEDKQQVRVLNRILTLTKNGVEYEADPRHAEIVIQDLGLKDAKGVVATGTKEEGMTKPDHEEKLQPYKATEYRAITARLNYLSSDRPDISFAVKELARSMSDPSYGCWDKLKRLGRYLITKPRAVIHFPYQSFPESLRIYSDADWAGCKVSRDLPLEECYASESIPSRPGAKHKACLHSAPEKVSFTQP